MLGGLLELVQVHLQVCLLFQVVLGREKAVGFCCHPQVLPNILWCILAERLDQCLGYCLGCLLVPWGILLGIEDPQPSILG